MKMFYIILLLFKVYFIKAEWHMPYFLDTETNGVHFEGAVGVQKINALEELSWPFQLAKINYEGRGTPKLGAFDIGDNSLLGAVIYQNDNAWFIVIEKRQDYENAQQRIYSFQIYIKDEELGDLEQSILLTLVNMFDNNPTLTYHPTPCRVEELQADFLTNCIFNVYDPDGMDRNDIRMIVQDNFDKSTQFSFRDFGEITNYEKQFQLFINMELHYEERAVYNLNVTVYDDNNNAGHIYAILEVIDLPNRDPVWVRPLTTASFDEKQEQYFTLKAIDGDTGINKPICYRLEFEEDFSELISINDTTGVLHVLPIDRDALNQQIFAFLTCAYKCDDPSWVIKNTTILVVQDVNDHIPKITLIPTSIQIVEAKYLTLDFKEFFVEDLDLGSNGTYMVMLRSNSNAIAYSEAFSLTPTTGYQRTNFSLNVVQAESLDYENPDWRNFELIIVAQEAEYDVHNSNCGLKVELINWNDEWPIFESENYEISILENATKDYYVDRVRAKDRDVGDIVIHSIVGNIAGFDINARSGVIVLSDDNVLDYERQNLVTVQIQAKDTLITSYSDVLHTSFAQLIINVLDVNDETPELRMPRKVINITENSPGMTLLTDKIEARDLDSTANLSFEILWEETYATKSGQEVLKENFEGCFYMELVYESNNYVYGLLRVNPDFPKQVDYEKYDTVFLSIKVRDMNQEINLDSITAVLTIRVDDVNDNAPEFAWGTLAEPRRVTEMEEMDTVIGSIEAFDIDGAGNNIITYAIRSVGNSSIIDIPFITINNASGVLRVSGNIECDVPKIYDLHYQVILTDTVHTTVGEFNISIVDINNRIPELDNFTQQVTIYENATTGDYVGQILAHDDDRDAPHNTLEYSINSVIGDTLNLFRINSTAGVMIVNLRNGLILDRDNGITYHYIPVLVKDNFNYNQPTYGVVNQVATFLNVTLLDVNDNAPLMPSRSTFEPEFSEADKKNTQSKAELLAIDIDEANTPNSNISYRIIEITPVLDNANNISKYNDIFDIVTTEKGYGKLVVTRQLKGYYGRWQILVEAFDHGEPVLSNSSYYEVNVRPYNFHAPKIQYPFNNNSIRVCYALQEANRPLSQADCMTRVPYFTALDTDGGEYGDVTFQLTSETGHDQYFYMVKEARNQSSLYLKQTLPAGIYYLNVRATDGGGKSSKELRNLKIVFVDMLGNPMFLESDYKMNFTENETGLTEVRYLPAAYDPKNEGLAGDDEQYKLYYFIDETVYPEAAKLFQLDSETRLLQLKKTLDREMIDMHRLRVKVSNDANGHITNPNSVNYTLDVYIMVNDVNDNAPRFTQDFYAAGITNKDSIGKEILTLKAIDPDLNDPTSYVIEFNTLTSQGANIEQHKAEFFRLHNATGVLSLNAYVANDMRGYIMFNVTALDTAMPPHSHTSSVKVYIVSEANRVKFVFLSDVQTIRSQMEFIKSTLQQIYVYDICNIDSIEDVTNQQKHNERFDYFIEKSVTAFITDVILHFIHNNEAVAAQEIQRRSTDLVFVSQLQNALQVQSLILNDVPHLLSADATLLVDSWLLTTFIALTVLLACCCACTVGYFVWKMRILKRQLKAFEPAEFGSMSSNINRIAAPTTNIFSVEGSNPVVKRQKAGLYERSMYEQYTSSDSGEEDDFGDLHNDPTFEMNNMNNCEQKKPQHNFEHKILNNNFHIQEKERPKEDAEQSRY